MATAKYLETIGRRKTASARVRLTETAKQNVSVNGKTLEEYFRTAELVRISVAPLSHNEKKFTITAVLRGGGIAGQAVALSHGIARAIVEFDATSRTPLKKLGLLKRDPRAKERKKPGLKKARKAAQWSKR
ncbi:MAG: 30S ribosomal protein S9 [Candidatus Pacebacteria bacterium]|nr:30S ribosomal protein S9 [Candidatus Paceibacterota bacterium]